jgi:hypothetical protein
MASAAPVVIIPRPHRPAGITALSGLLLLGGLWLLAETLLYHVRGLTGVFRLLAALVMGLLAWGLWKLHNSSRVFLFFLFVSDVIACLTALFLYALRTSHYRLAVALVVQILISAALAWYLQSAGVKRAFEGLNPWPTTVKMLVLTIFTVLLAFPFYWMVIATFKQNIDLYGMENNPFIFNLPPTLDNLRVLFNQTRFLTWLANTASVAGGLCAGAAHRKMGRASGNCDLSHLPGAAHAAVHSALARCRFAGLARHHMVAGAGLSQRDCTIVHLAADGVF